MPTTLTPPPGLAFDPTFERVIHDDRLGWLITEIPGRSGYDKHAWRFAVPSEKAAHDRRMAEKLAADIARLVAGARWDFAQAAGVSGSRLNRAAAKFSTDGLAKLRSARRCREQMVAMARRVVPALMQAAE